MKRTDVYQASLKHFLAPVQPLLEDPKVTEVMINGPDQIYFESGGRIQSWPHHFASEESVLVAARNIAEYVGRSIEGDQLAMDGRLPCGSRVHVILPPASRHCPCLTIRKFREAAFELHELVESGSLEPEAAEILQDAIESRQNVVVAGGTGTGKTSLLNALSRRISADDRIVVIEESSELRLEQEHVIYLEVQPDTQTGASISLRELFRNALRMRPDRILVGEVRGGEALDMVQAMLTGHAGSLSTLHASSPQAAAIRLETLCMQNDTHLPVYVARRQIAEAVDLLVQTQRVHGERYITEIAALTGLDSEQSYTWQMLYQREEQAIAASAASASWMHPKDF